MIFSRWRVPSWSALGDRATHESFVEEVRDQLRELELVVDEHEDGRVLSLSDGATLDLGDVSAAAAAVPEATWPDLVRGRIASATNPNRAPTSPEQLRPAVRTRLLTVEALQRFPKSLPHRRHADLAEVLVIHSRRSVVWAGEQDLEPLGLDLDRLFALARANVRSEGRPTVTDLAVDGGSVALAEGPDEYVASWAVLLDELVTVPTAGVVAAVPTSRTLLARPLDGPDARAAVEGLAAAAAARAADGPATLSARLLLWRDGRLEPYV